MQARNNEDNFGCFKPNKTVKMTMYPPLYQNRLLTSISVVSCENSDDKIRWQRLALHEDSHLFVNWVAWNYSNMSMTQLKQTSYITLNSQ